MNRPPKTQAALRKQIELILGTRVPDWAWSIAAMERAVSEVLQGDNTPEWLAQKLRAWIETGGPDGQFESKFIAPVRRQRRGKAVQSHQEAVSEAIAAIVRERKEVQSFRRDVLKGKTLKPEEVEAWIEDHTKDATSLHAAIVRLKTNFQIDERDEFGFKPLISSVNPEDIEGYAHLDTLAYAKPGSAWVHRVPVGRNGSLRMLYKLSRDLATYFHWQEAQATVFVLTDLTPVIDTENITLSSLSWVTVPYGGMEPLACLIRVTLTIDPMMTPEELARKYAVVRNRFLVKKPRALSPKHLALAVFATKHPALDSEAMEQWAGEFPQWKYQRVSLFARDARIARSRLLHQSPVGVPGTVRRAKTEPGGHTKPHG